MRYSGVSSLQHRYSIQFGNAIIRTPLVIRIILKNWQIISRLGKSDNLSSSSFFQCQLALGVRKRQKKNAPCTGVVPTVYAIGCILCCR